MCLQCSGLASWRFGRSVCQDQTIGPVPATCMQNNSFEPMRKARVGTQENEATRAVTLASRRSP